MSYSASNVLDALDEFEEERIIRQYEEECANEEVLDIRKLNLNGSVAQPNDDEKFDKCLNISDNEYLENLSALDNDSDRSSATKTTPLFINTSIPQFVLDNLNNLNQIAQLRMKPRDCFKALDNYRELTSSNSTINSNQLNDDSMESRCNGHDKISDKFNDKLSDSLGFSDRQPANRATSLTKSTHTNSLDQLNGDSLLNGHSSPNDSMPKNLSTTSSNENLLRSHSPDIRSPSDQTPTRRRKRNHSIVTFELISARTSLATETLGYPKSASSNKRFVLYTIIIKRAPGLETQPGIIEKRYSDFNMFFLSLRKSFPLYFQEFPFPKKIYSNNFEADVIAERSIVFQHLLTFMLSVRELRNSDLFHGFLLNAEYKKCRRLLRSASFEEAIICLENLLFILTKLNRVESSLYLQLNIFITYLALSACLNEIENFSESVHHADDAFKMVESGQFDTNELIIPFLLLSVQVNSRLSRCCKAQNAKLLELCSNGVIYDKKESLVELFVLKNYFVLTP